MDVEMPREITAKLAELDAFIEAEIKPLERDNIQFFDHRRENARTDWENDGRPRDEWRALISEMERRADKAEHLRYGLPKSCGAQAPSNLVAARTSGKPGEARGIPAFIVPTDTPGHNILYNRWTFNMPSDHAETELVNVRVPDSAILHKEGEGPVVAQRFVHENRVRQAAASAGAARYCIQETVKYAESRVVFGEPLAKKQAIQFPLVELWAEYELVRNFIFRTAWQMDRQNPLEISDMASICNFRANRLCCEAADRAMQVHGGIGCSRALPFEAIHRHHRRY